MAEKNYSAVGQDDIGLDTRGMPPREKRINDTEHADDHDNLLHKTGNPIARWFRNPRIMGCVIALLVLLLVIVAFLWWDVRRNENQGLSPDDGSCPVEFIPGIFEALYKDWFASLASYMIEGRYPCSVQKSQVYLTELEKNAAAFAGSISYYVGYGHMVTATHVLGNVTLTMKNVMDSTLNCPCASGTFFNPCGNAAAALVAQQQFAASSEAMIQYLVLTMQPLYDAGQLRAKWADVSKAIYATVVIARDQGIEPANTVFNDALETSILQLAALGEMLDYIPSA
jgi:hypothetical protein